MKKWALAILETGYTLEARKDKLDANIYKQIDKYLYDNRKFTLKCTYPCNDCKEDEPSYCLRCWGEIVGGVKNVNTFLQSTDGNSECKSQCDNKFTVNGNQLKYQMYVDLPDVTDLALTYQKCVECGDSCELCVGQTNMDKRELP